MRAWRTFSKCWLRKKWTLQYLHKAKYQNRRLMRWALTIQQFTYVVPYIKGSENVCADYLSRMWEDTSGGKKE